MAHILNRTIQNRAFLNRVNQQCIACIQWEVSSFYDEDKKHGTVEANIMLSDEARSHCIVRDADLAPVNKMLRELRLFKEAYKELTAEIKANGYTIKGWSAF